MQEQGNAQFRKVTQETPCFCQEMQTTESQCVQDQKNRKELFAQLEAFSYGAVKTPSNLVPPEVAPPLTPPVVPQKTSRRPTEGFHVATQPAPLTSDVPLLTAQGYNAVLELWVDRVIIKRQGINGLVLRGFNRDHKGDKEIPLQSIASIHFQKPSGVIRGYIQFVLKGGKEVQPGAFRTAHGKNSVAFSTSQTAAFEELRDAIYPLRKAILHQTGLPAALPLEEPATNAVSSLEQLASLRDRGIITEGEFQAKKKHLLGL